jgi:uncharacterized protein YidB (DUF937 family)
MTLPVIDWQAAALGPVKQHVSKRIADLIEKAVSPLTPLDQVPHHRGEIAALRWLLGQLDRPKDYVHD